MLLLVGILNVWTDSKSVSMTQAVLTLLWTFIFQLSVGQLGWALPAEIGSTRLRQKTICVARNVNGITGIVVGILQQYFMNPQAWNFKGYVGYVFFPELEDFTKTNSWFKICLGWNLLLDVCLGVLPTSGDLESVIQGVGHSLYE